jgi:hypothetical protein
VNKTFVPNLVESFRKIAKDEAAKFFFLESLGSNCIVLIVDGQWNVLAKVNKMVRKLSVQKKTKSN